MATRSGPFGAVDLSRELRSQRSEEDREHRSKRERTVMTAVRAAGFVLSAEAVLDSVVDALHESTDTAELIELLQKQLKRLHSL